uniref:Uncharacterized protein n=1 Tax=Trichobilharzia regenti TaxID=157069 RepID=A0AA85JBK5_TRIRE|nr:unnamed protein product [Trichobilharzia regenti]
MQQNVHLLNAEFDKRKYKCANINAILCISFATVFNANSKLLLALRKLIQIPLLMKSLVLPTFYISMMMVISFTEEQTSNKKNNVFRLPYSHVKTQYCNMLWYRLGIQCSEYLYKYDDKTVQAVKEFINNLQNRRKND